MAFPVPAEVLKAAREDAKQSQAILAPKMETVPSVVSKMEKGGEVEPEIARKYLTALGSEMAAKVLEYYGRDWSHGAPPSYLHPDRETIWSIDQALTSLVAFEKGPKNDPILRGPIDLLRSELGATRQYLDRRDHIVAWVGDIGVGKTTALNYAVGLVVGDGRSQRRAAFPTGAGRTTVCETAIRYASTYGVAVDAIEDEEVLRLTRDLVSSLHPETRAKGIGVPSEMARVLRNLSGTKVNTQEISPEEVVQQDPIADMFAEGLGVDEVVDRMITAMRLPDRRERQLVLPEGSDDGLNWVAKVVSRVNNGLDDHFSAPKRITVLMPTDRLGSDGQILSVVDTKGVEAVTQRADLTAYRDDPRTLVVLCTKFPDAPNASVQRHLADGVDLGSDAAQHRRQCILVLPRGEEATQVPGFDEPVSRAVGCAERRKDIAQALSGAGLPDTPVYFFDAYTDDADRIWQQLRGQIAQIRGVYAERAQTAVAGVENLISNVDIIKTAEARRNIETAVDRLVDQVRALPKGMRPAHLNLMEQIKTGHPSSIAASVVRGGEWESFPIPHILGVGVRIETNLRTNEPMSRIIHKIEDLSVEFKELDDVVRALKALQGQLKAGRQEFLTAGQTIGRDAYGDLLAQEQATWRKIRQRYGQGSGYKHDVAEMWTEYFTSGAAEPTAVAVDVRLQAAWEQMVIRPLVHATRT